MKKKKSNQKAKTQLSRAKIKNKVPTIEPTKKQVQFGENVFSTHGCIPFGADNLLPSALAQLCRKSAVHRGIINRKKEFIAGAKWSTENEQLEELLKNINANGENFTKVIKKVTLDILFGGNGWIEIVTNAKRNFLNLYHHDFTTCRLSKDKTACIISKDWSNPSAEKTEIPLYPFFVKDGMNRRSVLHISDYEPEFNNYGVPSWIAGLNVVAILYKTDNWNDNRLDNSFAPSGVFVLSGTFKSDEEAEEIVEELTETFSGDEGQGEVVFIAQDSDGKESKFIPFELKFDGDWVKLDENSVTKLIAAHSWYRSLTSLPDAKGFDTERILNEWRMAKVTTIEPFQRDLLDEICPVITSVTGIDTNDLSFINTPPVKESKSNYMKIWEARRADGLDYNPDDPKQQMYLANLNGKTVKNE